MKITIPTKKDLDKGIYLEEQEEPMLSRILALAMEKMANSPKEEYGKRTSGERCMYEIQREQLAGRTTGQDA